MDHSMFGGRATSVLGICLTLSIVTAMGFASAEPIGDSLRQSDSLHQCLLPAFDATASQACEAEAVAYAQALLNLEAAQDAADAAYAAWYRCENGVEPPAPEEPPLSPATVSILDR